MLSCVPSLSLITNVQTREISNVTQGNDAFHLVTRCYHFQEAVSSQLTFPQTIDLVTFLRARRHNDPSAMFMSRPSYLELKGTVVEYQARRL